MTQMVIENERREMSNGQRNRTAEPYLLYGLHGFDAAACGRYSIHDTD